MPHASVPKMLGIVGHASSLNGSAPSGAAAAPATAALQPNTPVGAAIVGLGSGFAGSTGGGDIRGLGDGGLGGRLGLVTGSERDHEDQGECRRAHGRGSYHASSRVVGQFRHRGDHAPEHTPVNVFREIPPS
jgi:hypothetical protein